MIIIYCVLYASMLMDTPEYGPDNLWDRLDDFTAAFREDISRIETKHSSDFFSNPKEGKVRLSKQQFEDWNKLFVWKIHSIKLMFDDMNQNPSHIKVSELQDPNLAKRLLCSFCFSVFEAASVVYTPQQLANLFEYASGELPGIIEMHKSPYIADSLYDNLDRESEEDPDWPIKSNGPSLPASELTSQAPLN